jgi:ubiquinone/menaquinone biosynthesis C-methylase UbiE
MFRTGQVLMAISPGLRRTLHRVFYNYLARLDAKQGEIILMNYGYTNGDKPIQLEAGDEENRLCLQLYHRVAGALDLTGKEVLEVGSGRGGGASYVKRYLGPRTVTGADYAAESVAFCNRHHVVDGLRYVHGDAENLPFEDSSFDAVINVESSHCYGSMAKFVGQVFRVLRSGGMFSWADMRKPHELDGVRADMRAAGFEIVRDESIRANVLASMAVQSERYQALIQRKVPRIAHPLFTHFAGVEGTSMHGWLTNGDLEYQHMVLRKPE